MNICFCNGSDSGLSEVDMNVQNLASSNVASTILQEPRYSPDEDSLRKAKPVEHEVLGGSLELTQCHCKASIDTQSLQTPIPSRLNLECETTNDSVSRARKRARESSLQPLRQVKKLLTNFQKTAPRWTNPEASVGSFCGKKEKFSCWKAKGPAQDAFNLLGKEIAEILDRSCRPVPGSSHVIFNIYMVGKTPGTAVPQVMFSCKTAGPRKEAMNVLRKSGILQKYPGIETGHWQFPPDITNPPQFMAYGMRLNSPALVNRVLLATLPSVLPSCSQKTISALRLYTVDHSEVPEASHTATVGSVARFAGKYCYFSVSHALVGRDINESEEDESDSEFEFGGIMEDVKNHDSISSEEMDFSSSARMISDSSSSHDNISREQNIGESSGSFKVRGSENYSLMPKELNQPYKPGNLPIDPQDLLLDPDNAIGSKRLDVELATLTIQSVELDYALFEHTSEDNTTTNLFRLPVMSLETVSKIPPGETRILAVTGSSGRCSGVLSGRPSYIRLMFSTCFQEAYTVEINGHLATGDSGSIVCDSETYKIYGHMVIGSTASGVAYIIPAYNVLKDMKLREEELSQTEIGKEGQSIKTLSGNEEIGSIPTQSHPDINFEFLPDITNTGNQPANLTAESIVAIQYCPSDVSDESTLECSTREGSTGKETLSSLPADSLATEDDTFNIVPALDNSMGDSKP